MSFTRRHYEEVARILRRERERYPDGSGAGDDGAHNALLNVQAALRAMFYSDNPRFDPERFNMACEPKGEK